MKNSSNTIGNRTRDLPICSTVLQPTALLRAPIMNMYLHNYNYSYNNNYYYFIYQCVLFIENEADSSGPNGTE